MVSVVEKELVESRKLFNPEDPSFREWIEFLDHGPQMGIYGQDVRAYALEMANVVVEVTSGKKRKILDRSLLTVTNRIPRKVDKFIFDEPGGWTGTSRLQVMAKEWLNSHLDSVPAQQVAMGGIYTSYRYHLGLVGEMLDGFKEMQVQMNQELNPKPPVKSIWERILEKNQPRIS